MPEINAEEDNRLYSSACTDIDHRTMVSDQSTLRTDEEIQWHIDHLPMPPHGSCFSRRQRADQYLFFKDGHDKRPPSSHLDLYNATVLFVCKFHQHPSLR